MSNFVLASFIRAKIFSNAIIFIAVSFAEASDQLLINTSYPTPTIYRNGSLLLEGRITTGCFTGPNKKTWNYSRAVFDGNDRLQEILGQNDALIEFRGPNGVRLNFTSDVTIAAKLDLSGVRVTNTSCTDGMFRLGGFVRKNNSCCALGKIISLSLPALLDFTDLKVEFINFIYHSYYYHQYQRVLKG